MKFEYQTFSPSYGVEALNRLGGEGWRCVGEFAPGLLLLERTIREQKEVTNYLTEEFMRAWNFYGKHGNRKSSAVKWSKLTKGDKDAIREHMPRYVASTEISGKGNGTKTFRKNLETYLSQRHWENDITVKVEHREIIKERSKQPGYINSPEHLKDLRQND